MLASALASAGCCHTQCGLESAPPVMRERDPGGVVTVGTDAGIVCTGTVIRAEKVDDGWRHQVLTAKHCFGDYRGGDLPTAEVRALVDGGYEIFKGARLEVWSERMVDYSSPVAAVGFETVKWVADDWSILTLTVPLRLQTIPLAVDQEAAKLRRGDGVAMFSYLDRAWPMKLGFHTHDFAWGAVPPELSEDGHSGAPIVRNGRVIGIYVAALTNSAFCRAIFGCRDRASDFVSVQAIRGSAQRQGFLVDD